MLTFALTMVRHGETQYNRDKLLQGQGVDTPLSDTGHQQAMAAGRYLKDLHFTNVFVSNLQRAMQTAEIILGNNIHSSATEMVLDPLLRERGFGVAEGKPKEHLKNMANAAGLACRDYTPPGGETLEQVRTRFRKFLKTLYKSMVEDHESAFSPHLSDPEEPVINGLADDGVKSVPVHALVVSHGAFIRVSVRHLIEDLQCSVPVGVRINQLFSPCPNTGISRFIFSLCREESGLQVSRIHCVFVNRKEHLEELKLCN
ncbi:hypothetical protein DNTS_001494 [Danionella cerebrum]|uniref:fructose-2,6-bisphosphate 2-phosphatase n=1 Tax=Danionella cerebrum TaxID=2873325 RepID=A0A553RGI4_9TELE|nr:hypothetical protein DNTS_001494 [Danionella translucida]